MDSTFLIAHSKFASFIFVYLVQIYIGLLESFLQIPVISFYFVMLHVLCHKLLNNNSRLFVNNFCLKIGVCEVREFIKSWL